ncbi:hypothetical protein JYT36_00375 [Bacteroidales bacterium AH-315-N07]|nr:hypothetical protein [Bacteroidales bacterium AH-315-N07]
MGLGTYKHKIEEINGVRCSIAEKGVSEGRADFLKALLEHNNFEVILQKEEEDGTITVGVTDICFDAVVLIYQRAFKTPDGRLVTHAYWDQDSGETNPIYWRYKK